jgi:acetolactate synthase regulatory subunit
MSFGELDPVVLDVDIPGRGLPRQSLGAVVHVHTSDVFEVEFVTASGRTAALLTLKASQLRKVTDDDLICVSRIPGSVSPHRWRPRPR